MTQTFQEVTAGQSTDLPAKMVIFGVPKIGKTRFAAEMEDAFFINIENGLDYLPTKVRATPHLKTYDDVIGWLKHIYSSDTFTAGRIVIDSIDWAEALAQDRLIKLHNAASITDSAVKAFAYHNGVMTAADDTIKIMGWLDAIYQKKGIPALLIAHQEVKTVDMPNKDPYQQHQLKLSKRLAGKVEEWADLILFADYSFHVTKDGKTSEPKPSLLTGGSAAYKGGGRMKLEREIPLSYKALTQHFKGSAK